MVKNGLVSEVTQIKPIKMQQLLNNSDCHIWLFSLNIAHGSACLLMNLLSKSECRELNKIKFHKQKIRYVAAHAGLRSILGSYLQLQPRFIRFGKHTNGKPFVTNGDIKFNLTHSRSMAAVIITKSLEVGIDMEMVRGVYEADRIVKTCFSNATYTYFKRLPARLKKRLFFVLWTRREALIKAGDQQSQYNPKTQDLFSGLINKSTNNRGNVYCSRISSRHRLLTFDVCNRYMVTACVGAESPVYVSLLN